MPVYAAGGIGDGRGVAAVLALGAQAAALGTAFLLAAESGIVPAYRRVLASERAASTVLTRTFSGRTARGVPNRVTRTLRDPDDIAPYPFQNAMTRDIRTAAAAQHDPEYLSLWAGQAARARARGARGATSSARSRATRRPRSRVFRTAPGYAAREEARTMIARISSHWWVFLIRGILALALGIAMPFFPGAAIFAIAILFGAYAFVDGIFAIVAAVRMNHAESRWPWLIVEGVLGILVGVITFFAPLATIVGLAYLVGFWFIVTGLLSVATGVRMRGHLANEIWLIVVGLLSILAGIIVYFTPLWGLFVLVWTISVYAILAGIFFIGLAFRLRRLAGAGATPPPA